MTVSTADASEREVSGSAGRLASFESCNDVIIITALIAETESPENITSRMPSSAEERKCTHLLPVNMERTADISPRIMATCVPEKAKICPIPIL